MGAMTQLHDAGMASSTTNNADDLLQQREIEFFAFNGIMMVFEQFHHEWRSYAHVGNQVSPLSSPGEGHVKQTPLFGKWKLLLNWQQSVQQGMGAFFGGKTVLALFQAQDDDIVGLLAFGGIDAHGLYVKFVETLAIVG
jgi:hypothetical protein